MRELSLRREIIATALRMNELRINRGRSGTVSARTGRGFLITPTGLSYEEIGDVLKIPAKTVKSRVHTARERLAQMLRELK